MHRQRLLRLFDQMAAEQRALLAELDVFLPSLLEQAPPHGGWTIAQVITHMATVEEGAVDYLRKKLEFNKHQPVSATAGVRLLVLNAGIRLPVKYKAPKVVADIPATTYAVARDRWTSARDRLTSAYASVPDDLLRHELFKHPFMGRFCPLQGLHFMRLHARRHHGQVHRILRALA